MYDGGLEHTLQSQADARENMPPSRAMPTSPLSRCDDPCSGDDAATASRSSVRGSGSPLPTDCGLQAKRNLWAVGANGVSPLELEGEHRNKRKASCLEQALCLAPNCSQSPSHPN